jgi:hypothetical protein
MNISFAMPALISTIPKMSNNETKNNSNMGNHSHNALHSRPTSGSVLPVTPYEIWQSERYGNFISESNPIPQEPGKTFFEYQIEIFEHDEIYNQ